MVTYVDDFKMMSSWRRSSARRWFGSIEAGAQITNLANVPKPSAVEPSRSSA
jgi:hypothetical protein